MHAISLFHIFPEHAAGDITKNFIRNGTGNSGVLPGSDLSLFGLANNDDLVSDFHSGNAGHVHGGEIHSYIADDRGVVVLDNDSSMGGELAVQSITIAHREHCDLGRELGNVTAAVTYGLALGNFPYLNDPGLPGE